MAPKGKFPHDEHIILRRHSPGFDGRVVKEAVFLVLQRVFEDLFLPSCHSFRPGRGFHTALQDLRHWRDVSFFVKLTVRDVKADRSSEASGAVKAFVNDGALVELLQQMVDYRHLELQWKTPVKHDGSILSKGLSFLWTNICLHRVDSFVRQELENLQGTDADAAKKKQRKQYVRHAGNLLVGYSGTDRVACQEFYNKVSSFVESEQGLIVDSLRSGIRHYTRKVDYLGFGVSYKPVLQPESFRGEVHLQRLKRACKILIQTRMEHIDRINRQFQHAVSHAIGITLKESFDDSMQKGMCPPGIRSEQIRIDAKLEDDLHWERMRMEISNKATGSEIRGLQTNSVKILGALKQMIKESKYKDAYHPRPSSTLLNELASRALPPKVMKASLDIDRTLRGFYQKVLRAEADARKSRKVDAKLIQNMWTGNTWFSSVDLLAPIDELKKLLEEAGFFKRGKETHVGNMFNMTDEGIVLLYAHVALSILKYYRCANNLPQVRLLVNYHLRYSCLLTITGKHQKTLPWTIENYTKDLIIKVDEEDGTVVKRPFPSRKQVLSMKHDFFKRPSPTPPWEVIRHWKELRKSVDRETAQRESRGGA
ncbi:uncharacterized protein LOC112340501 [Selaginella moellendorffii]|uniref:uncharacterized protein LOC112340501 n=1 Tax=Selaginella moellendorffii TaxID=88036 RepID=UPI000D1CBDFE|nr:uncharacterized protein LOC112340501 [Selaginella moellendorffii]|eukprot:XP_024514755.1 uncharacterized protein LOC112340501 [Selaginella moellendorffii]